MKKLKRLMELIDHIYEAYYEIDEVLEELSRDEELDEDNRERFSHFYRIYDADLIDDIWEVADAAMPEELNTIPDKELSKEYLQDQIDKVSASIKMKESFLKWAKQDDVRQSLYQDIYTLSLQRDIYLNLLKGC